MTTKQREESTESATPEQSKHIRFKLDQLPKEGYQSAFAYCEACNGVNMRNCAHADSCGFNIEFLIVRKSDRESAVEQYKRELREKIEGKHVQAKRVYESCAGATDGSADFWRAYIDAIEDVLKDI